MQAAFAIYPCFTALDVVGPFQVLSCLPDVDCVYVAEEAGPVTDHTGTFTLVADKTFNDVPRPDLVVVSGNGGAPIPTTADPLVQWVRAAHASSQWTTSVCSGSLYLGAAGLLRGQAATSHWAVLELLRDFGAEPTSERVVFADRVVTAAGVSSGIDMALALVDRMWGRETAEAVQLVIEYDPQPPVDSGSPQKASTAVMDVGTKLLTRLVELGSLRA